MSCDVARFTPDGVCENAIQNVRASEIRTIELNIEGTWLVANEHKVREV